MSSRERDEIYGGSVIILGAMDGHNLAAGDDDGSSDPYLTLVMVDENGKEIAEEKHYTRVVEKSLNPQWDEVFCFGQGVDLQNFAALKVKVKDFDTPLHSDHLGEFTIPLEEIRENADATSSGVWDGWFKIEDTRQQKGEASGQIHLRILFHAPPPDPEPSSVAVRIVEAKDLISADTNGFSDPFVRVKPTTRQGKDVKDAAGKAVELKTTIQKVTLNPTWNEIMIFNDVALGPINDIDGFWDYPWGWPEGVPENLKKLPLAHSSAELASATGMHFTLKDYDFGKLDDE
jgi:Ca2+-dependent lipid-binding protein